MSDKQFIASFLILATIGAYLIHGTPALIGCCIGIGIISFKDWINE